MFAGYDFDVIQRSLPYLFRDGMTFTLTLTALAAGIAWLIVGLSVAELRRAARTRVSR